MKSYFIITFIIVNFLVQIINYEYSYKFNSHNRNKLKKHNLRKSKYRSKKDEKQSSLFKLPQKFDEIQQFLNEKMHDNKLNRNNFEELFRNRGLTKGELKNIWSTIDSKKEDKITEKEWRGFHKLFIEDFENCDSDGDYLLETKELGICLEESKYLQNLGVKKEEADMVMESVDRDEDMFINFADYLFLRRVKLGWEKCGCGQQLSKVQIPCAMKIAVPGWIMSEIDANQIFQSIMAIEVGLEKYEEVYMNIKQYLEYAHIYYYFISFEIPFYNGNILKQDIIRAIDYQQVPTTLNKYLVDQIFQDQTSIHLKQFGVSLILYRTFKRHCKINKFYMSKEEFSKIFDDFHINKAIVKMIDSFTINSQEEFEEASFISHEEPSESDYLITFLQTQYNYKYHHRHRDSLKKEKEIRANIQNREQVYNIFEFKGKDMLSFQHFVRWWKTSWFFLNCDQDNTDVLEWQQLRECIAIYPPPIPFTIEEQSYLQYAQDFIANPKIHSLNLKAFYDMFQYRDIFQIYRAPNFISYVSQPNLHKSFFFMGLKVTQNTLDVSLQGQDPATKMPLYNYWAAYSNAMNEEIIAQKNQKDQDISNFLKQNNIKRKRK